MEILWGNGGTDTNYARRSAELGCRLPVRIDLLLLQTFELSSWLRYCLVLPCECQSQSQPPTPIVPLPEAVCLECS